MCTYNSIIKFVISTAEALDIMSEKRNLLEKSLNLFTLNKVDRDIYSWNGKNVGWGRVFGGQVMAQTLIAAYKTIDVEHYAHSFHSYFLRPGDMEKPIIFTVDRIRNGKSFSTRNFTKFMVVMRIQQLLNIKKY